MRSVNIAAHQTRYILGVGSTATHQFNVIFNSVGNKNAVECCSIDGIKNSGG
jgi:hypothetical protein